MSTQHQAPQYNYAPESPEHKNSTEHEHHGFQRPHREPGQLELGITEVAEGRTDVARHVVASGGIHNSAFRQKWQLYRPDWLAVFLAEATGVFFFTFAGGVAIAEYVLSGGTEGSFFNIGISYCFGIVFGIYMAGGTSGSHLHPAITIAQWLFKGFPLRKVPLYIIAQLTGGFVGALIVYAVNKSAMDAYALKLTSAGAAGEALFFTAEGPAGILALFPAERSYGTMFANEWFGCMAIGLVIWSQLDSQNIFTSPTVAPFSIGLAFFFVVSNMAPGAVALNSARDVGARFACAALYGRQCFSPAKYTALAALTNIPATLVAVAMYTFFFSDTRRPPAPVALSHLLEEERNLHMYHTKTHDELVKARTRTE